MARFISIFLFALLPTLASASSIFDELTHQGTNQLLAVTLTLPVDSIMARSVESHKGTFHFFDAEGRTQSWSVKISTRGKFRRARCEMPPLKLDFSKKDLKEHGLNDFDKYKLVVPCFENPQAEELVMKEYLAYQAYHLITPFSFRTQLLKLTIRDLNGGPDHIVTAFIIENTDEMAARNGGIEADDLRGTAADYYDAEAEATHAMFQYFVGNGDWSLLLRRNVKVIRVGERFIPVGYDFDFTGFVGAPYATATSDAGQHSIYDRVYLGYAQRDEIIDSISLKFKEKRREILKLIAGADINPDNRTTTYRFASRFFSRINRLRSNADLTLYDQLRGATAEYIPTGEAPQHFRSMGK